MITEMSCRVNCLSKLSVVPMEELVETKSRDHCVDRVTNILNDVFKCLCVLGFMIQLSYVLFRYAAFEYLTFTIFNVPDETKLPDFFFCSDFISFLNFTLLFQRYPQLLTAFGLSRVPLSTPQQSIKDQLLTRSSVRNVSIAITQYLSLRQVTECLYTTDELFGGLNIRHALNKKITDLCDFRLFYRAFMVCFVFVCSLDGPIITTTNDFYKDPVPPELFLLEFRQSFFRSVDYVFIGATLPTTLPVSPSCKMDVQTMTDYPRAFRYHLKTVQLNLLPPPYLTNCRNYARIKTDNNYTSRDGVLDECLTRKTVQITGCPHPLSLQSSHWDLPFAAECYERNYNNISYRKLINSIVDECFRLNSQPDCSRTAYFIQGRAPVAIFGDFGTFVLDSIVEPIISVDYEPKMTWLDCLVQIGSCLATWFGFSILIHIPKISRFLVHKLHFCVTCCEPSDQVLPERKSIINSASHSLSMFPTSPGKKLFKPAEHPIRYISPTQSMIRRRSLLFNPNNRIIQTKKSATNSNKRQTRK